MGRKVTRRNSRRRSTRVARRSTRSLKRSIRKNVRRSARRSSRALKRSIRKNVKRSSRRSTRRSNRRRNMRKEIMVGGTFASMPMAENAANASMPSDVPDMRKHISNLMLRTLAERQQELIEIHAAHLSLWSTCNQCPVDLISGGGKIVKSGKSGKNAPKTLGVGMGKRERRSTQDVLALHRGARDQESESDDPLSPNSARAAVVGQRMETNPGSLHPTAQYHPPPDSRPEWDVSRHGVMVTTWHTIAKNAFKALIGLTLSNTYVAGATTAFTVGQLFGTLDKLLITLISVGIGTACAGIATYTGAAVAGVSLYTILRSAYIKAAGLTQEELVSNVAASCYVADVNLRNHVTTTAQEMGPVCEYLNSPSFIELLKTISSSVDHVSSAMAGLFVSRFVKKLYRPPAISDDAQLHQQIAFVTEIIGDSDYYVTPTPDKLAGDPWLLALVRTKTQTVGNPPQYIPLFDKWSCISIPAIHEDRDVLEQQNGREQVNAVIEMGSRILAAPSQIIHDSKLAKYNKKQGEIQNAFTYISQSLSQPTPDISKVLDRYIIEGLHDYFTIRGIDLTSIDAIDARQLAQEIDLFLEAWRNQQSVLSGQGLEQSHQRPSLEGPRLPSPEAEEQMDGDA